MLVRYPSVMDSGMVNVDADTRQGGVFFRCLVGAQETLGQIEWWAPLQHLSKLPRADLSRPEPAADMARDEKAGQSGLVSPPPCVDPVRSLAGRERQPVWDRNTASARAGASEIVPEVAPHADVVAIDDVERMPGRPSAIDHLG